MPHTISHSKCAIRKIISWSTQALFTRKIEHGQFQNFCFDVKVEKFTFCQISGWATNTPFKRCFNFDEILSPQWTELKDSKQLKQRDYQFLETSNMDVFWPMDRIMQPIPSPFLAFASYSVVIPWGKPNDNKRLFSLDFGHCPNSGCTARPPQTGTKWNFIPSWQTFCPYQNQENSSAINHSDKNPTERKKKSTSGHCLNQRWEAGARPLTK